MQFPRQSIGQLITLDSTAPIGAGGEGSIYAVQNDGALVAKVYHKPTDDVYAQKLAAMVANPPDDPMATQGGVSIAWPTDLLQTADRSQRVIGFLMPRVAEMRPIFTFYNPGDRRQQFPLFNYAYLLQAARNLATIVRVVHSRGYVIGDVKEANVLMSERALVALVDTDSFQVRDHQKGIVYRCPVGTPDFTPPELQGRSFGSFDRAPEHDRFGLAVLIFQLLMEGTYPFAGLFQGSGELPPREARIKAGHFPYGTRRVPYHPPRSAPPFAMLAPSIQQLFLRCFEDGHNSPSSRPDAQTWRLALGDVEKVLTTCAVNEQHRYSNHLQTCPWCKRTAQLGGLDPFPSHEAVQRGQHLRSVVTKPASRQRQPQWQPPQPTPTPAPTLTATRTYTPTTWRVPAQAPQSRKRLLWGTLVFAVLIGLLLPQVAAVVRRTVVQWEEAWQKAAARRHVEEEAQRRAEDEQRGIGEMVSVPAGEFFMGCNEKVDTECKNDEKPGRQVFVGAFEIDKTEVTVAAYRYCVDVGRCSQPNMGGSCNWETSGREDHPINCVDWNQAKTYCTWAGKRLPTEEEWEKAARGTDGRSYPWGNEWDARKANTSRTADGYRQTTPVGSFPSGASPYEALDMAGNVLEWTTSAYGETLDSWFSTGNTVLRGGSWLNKATKVRVASRFQSKSGGRGENFGFRCAR